MTVESQTVKNQIEATISFREKKEEEEFEDMEEKYSSEKVLQDLKKKYMMLDDGQVVEITEKWILSLI